MLYIMVFVLIQVRIYNVAIPDAEIDTHLAEAGVVWQVHQKYMTGHFSMNDNSNSLVLIDTGLLASDGTIYSDPVFVEVRRAVISTFAYDELTLSVMNCGRLFTDYLPIFT